MTSAPQKNPNIAPQQMLYESKEKIKQILKQSNVNPQVLINLGDMSMAAIKDKALYPMVWQALEQSGLSPKQQKSEGIDYKLLAHLVAAGKIANMISQEGNM
jgi:hypothetical protein